MRLHVFRQALAGLFAGHRIDRSDGAAGAGDEGQGDDWEQQ